MTVFKCKMCGADLTLVEGSNICECEYCGTQQTVPTADNDKKMNLFNRANRLRFANEFDKASGVFESIVSEFPEEAEAYWGLCLCKYGIEYVDDPATAKKIPTCHRTSYDSIFNDSNFEMAQEYADVVARKLYREEAKEIDRLQKSILAIAQNEEPFDIFICYKETAEDGQRTIDSVLAQDMYDALTEKGYKVFFARITLEDKLGQEYEPYIFSALSSAKVMLAVGTSYEYYNAVWVKNEWGRFLDMMKSDKKKVLIPCYRDIDAYDIPSEFKHLQAQDMGKVGFMQDLIRGIDKITGNDKINGEHAYSKNGTVESILTRAFMFLEEKEWKRANEYFESILDNDPENGMAYLGLLMTYYRASVPENLTFEHAGYETSEKLYEQPLSENKYYKKAVKFLNSKLSDNLRSYNRINQKEWLRKKYEIAIEKMNSSVTENEFLYAAELFSKILDYQESRKYFVLCKEKADNAAKTVIYNDALEAKRNTNSVDEQIKAIRIFKSLKGFSDSDRKQKECKERIYELKSAEKDLEIQNYLKWIHDQSRNATKEKTKLFIRAGLLLVGILGLLYFIFSAIQISYFSSFKGGVGWLNMWIVVFLCLQDFSIASCTGLWIWYVHSIIAMTIVFKKEKTNAQSIIDLLECIGCAGLAAYFTCGFIGFFVSIIHIFEIRRNVLNFKNQIKKGKNEIEKLKSEKAGINDWVNSL